MLTLAQSLPKVPGQDKADPMAIPLSVALFDRETLDSHGEHLLTLSQPEQSFRFPGFNTPPVLSINRGFSAPVAIERDVPAGDLVFLAAHDDDPFARYEAMQDLVVGQSAQVAEEPRRGLRIEVGERLVDHEQLRLEHEDPGHGEQLPLAPGQRRGLAPEQRFDARLPRHLRDPGPDVGARGAQVFRPEGELGLDRGTHDLAGGVLEHRPDVQRDVAQLVLRCGRARNPDGPGQLARVGVRDPPVHG